MAADFLPRLTVSRRYAAGLVQSPARPRRGVCSDARARRLWRPCGARRSLATLFCPACCRRGPFCGSCSRSARRRRSACRADRETSAPVVRLSPPQLADTARLTTLGAEQRKSASRFAVFHDFRSRTACPKAASPSAATWSTTRARRTRPCTTTTAGSPWPTSTATGYSDIYFVNQVGGNQLWRNLGGGRFEDITAPAGMALATRRGDGVVRRHRQRRRRRPLRHHRSRRQPCSRTTATAGSVTSGAPAWTTPATPPAPVFFDYNRDGKLDLFLVNVGRYTRTRVGRRGLPVLRRPRGRIRGAPQARAGRARACCSGTTGGNRFTT